MPKYPKIKSKIIKYKNAPSGKANIGKYVPPFEKNKSGYGFMGVVVQDAKSDFLECSICGGWFENLPTHIRKHKLTSVEYKKQFGLMSNTALKSDRLRLLQSKVMIGLRKKNKKNRPKFAKNNKWTSNRKKTKIGAEYKNKYGVCDLQIMNKIRELHNEMGKTPTLIDLQKRYGSAIMLHIHKRFGSYISLCNKLGYTANYSNYNPKYNREYFIEKALSNEASIRIFTLNERRALYKYIKGGIKELKREVAKYG